MLITVEKRSKSVKNFQDVFVCLWVGLVLKMAYRAFEGLISGVFDSEVAYLTYDQYYAPRKIVMISLFLFNNVSTS